MRAGRFIATVLAAATVVAGIVSAQLPFREYEGAEYSLGEVPKPPNWRDPGEWIFARLMYPQSGRGRAFGPRGMWDWRQGGSSWTIDYPRADRHMIEMTRRLTRVDARPVEQPVNLDDLDDVMNFPWMYVVEPGTWELSDEQAKKLRDYLLRGGFLMTDDFHGLYEWNIFMDSMSRVFPDRKPVDVPSTHPSFHTLWDLDERYQVPGEQFLYSGRTWEPGAGRDQSGQDPHWRGIYDDTGRLMVAICHNMDLGDSVEHSDNPAFPEKYSAQGMRTFIDYLIYAMSH
jgi:hypothetical protein